MLKARGLLMKPGDNVITVVEEAESNAVVFFENNGIENTQVAIDRIPFGHKMAIRDIAAGDIIRKYGEPISVATCAIKAGQHVHIHNTESQRGRGDKG